MEKFNNKLIDKKIISVKSIEDGILINLGDGSKLNLYNEVYNLDIDCINGKKIVDQLISSDNFTLVLDNGYKISMSLKHEDYLGPEALVYRGIHNEIVVI